MASARSSTYHEVKRKRQPLDLGRILKAELVKEFEVGELDHGEIEGEEGEHDSDVHILRDELRNACKVVCVERSTGEEGDLSKFMRTKPCDGLSLNLSLVIDTLQTNENR